MTSSGITGSNGHCVVESPPKLEKPVNSFWIPGASIPGLIVAGGLSPRSTSAVAETAGEWVAQYSSHDLSRLFGRRVRSLTWRSFAVETGNKLSRFSEPALIPKSAPPLVFVFSGQGPQHFESTSLLCLRENVLCSHYRSGPRTLRYLLRLPTDRARTRCGPQESRRVLAHRAVWSIYQ